MAGTKLRPSGLQFFRFKYKYIYLDIWVDYSHILLVRMHDKDLFGLQKIPITTFPQEVITSLCLA
jgi:hypothetical protein